MFTSLLSQTISKTNNVPQWFMDLYKKGGFITNTNKAMGTVVMPTGYGKSAQMFSDAIHHIKTTEGKIVIIFAAPILKLVAQTQNDFMNILGEMCHDLRDNEQIRFFVNSSAHTDDYDYRAINANPYYFKTDFTRHFLNDDNAKVALIASCYDSLEDVANKIETISKNATICCYLDEAHLVITKGRDSMDIEVAETKGNKKVMKTYNVLDKLCACDFLYAVTATTDNNITKTINKKAYEKYHDESYLVNDYVNTIVNITAKEAIHDNIILPFNMDIIAAPTDEMAYPITPEMCIQFMNHVKENDTNQVPHKILVSCHRSADHLKYLESELKSRGYKVFSTCSKYKTMGSNDDNEMVGIDENEFIKEVDGYNGDCFVLHIRQLTQGIDIKTLTDTIMYCGSVINDGEERKIIQRIGRVLRTLGNERGHKMSDRTKKYGNVFFVLPNGDTLAHIAGQIENLLVKYYGFDGILNLAHGHEGSGSERGGHKVIVTTDENLKSLNPQNIIDLVINDWKIKLDDYVREQVINKIDFLKQHGVQETYNLAIQDILNYSYKYMTECELSELLTDTPLMDYAEALCKKYAI